MNKCQKVNDKLKILIVHNYYQIPGGEDTVVSNERRILEENGNEVFLYSRNNSELKNFNKIEKLVAAFSAVFSIKTYIKIKKLINELNIDIVHVHNTLFLVSPSVYYAARICKVPVVQTIHNFRLLCPGATFTRNNKICEDCIAKGVMNSVRHKCYRNSLTQTFLSALILKIHRLSGTYAKINCYIALTEFNRNKLSKLVDENKIFVKPNFIFKNQEISYSTNRNHFLFLGRLDKLKGIDMLVDAWSQIDKDKLIIAGTGPLEKDIKNKIKNNKIKNVKCIGFKSKDEIKELMYNSRAVIVPSQWYEGFPMTILEAFSFGVPVIASDLGNLSSIVKDKENGLLFKYVDKESLVEKIRDLSENDDLFKKLSMGALATFNEKYNEDINYSILRSIYEECLGGTYDYI